MTECEGCKRAAIRDGQGGAIAADKRGVEHFFRSGFSLCGMVIIPAMVGK